MQSVMDEHIDRRPAAPLEANLPAFKHFSLVDFLGYQRPHLHLATMLGQKILQEL